MLAESAVSCEETGRVLTEVAADRWKRSPITPRLDPSGEVWNVEFALDGRDYYWMWDSGQLLFCAAQQPDPSSPAREPMPGRSPLVLFVKERLGAGSLHEIETIWQHKFDEPQSGEVAVTVDDTTPVVREVYVAMKNRRTREDAIEGAQRLTRQWLDLYFGAQPHGSTGS